MKHPDLRKATNRLPPQASYRHPNRTNLIFDEIPISTAFLFPGQGAQTVGMARELTASFPAAKALFDQAADILGYDLLALCTHGPAERLNATDVSQPAIFVTSLAALKQLKATQPDALQGVTATAGLSLGEYTALAFAGSLSFADGLRVVQARGRAMQAAAEATPSAMASLLGAERADVEALVAEHRGTGTLEVANLLCPGNTVVSGTTPEIEAICRAAEAKGFRPIRLAVAGAFHTSLMQPADEQLAAALQAVTLTAPRIPVWSNVDAQPHTDPAEIQALLVRQVLSPVRWEETMRGLLASGMTRFYEIGPGRVLAGLLKRINRKLDIQNVTA
ncbi:MAG: ACP S-malonyltransferase [Bacteroidales bacterium]|nr:ACP S-malonyltransferase [Bacteroidales bacterium]